MTTRSLPHPARAPRPRRGDAPTQPARGRSVTGWPLVRRLLTMTTVGLFYFVLELVAKSVVVVQLGFVLASGAPRPGVSRFADALAAWMAQLWRFVTFVDDRAPWPFSPWPAGAAAGTPRVKPGP